MANDQPVAELQQQREKRARKQFFIVFSPEGLSPPKIVHQSHKAALYAAVQMAKQYPEASFFVMGSMSPRVKPREQTEELEAA